MANPTYPQIKAVFLTVDRTLTDGKEWLQADGQRRRRFSVRDNMAIRVLQREGYSVVAWYPKDVQSEYAAHFKGLPVETICCAPGEFSPRWQQWLAGKNIAASETLLISGGPLPPEIDGGFGLTMSFLSSPLDWQRRSAYVARAEVGDGAVSECINWFLQQVAEMRSASSM